MAIDAAQVTSAGSRQAGAAERAGPHPVIQKKYLRKNGEPIIFVGEHSRCVGLNEVLAVWSG